MLNRIIESKLLEMATKFPVIAITGPRQSGKTTLCKKLFKDYRYVSLENPDNKEFALSDPKGFLEEYNDNVIIDEVQNAPELFSYIQGIVDESKKTGQYILTGSQNFLLLEKISQTLAGRIYIYHLLPFSYSELNVKYKQVLLTHIFKGGYPRIYDKDIHPSDFFPSYIQTYLERDVRTILNIKDINKFGMFVKICAGRIGQIFNSSNIANELGIDHKTVISWLSILEASFIVYRLQPWHTNFNKRTIKSPKIYFYDTGLACYLLGLKKESELKLHFAKGSLFENYVITEHLKNRLNIGLQLSSYFWRDSSGNEIDLLVEEAKTLKIVEIKSGKTIKTDFFKGLNKFEKLANNFTVKKLLVYGGNESQKRSHVQILSWKDVKQI
ncbi:ATP-binding protein [Flavobacteriaceae bacterium PRS1]|nr:ATP-binding protein [Flavobacteriaceae bacterium PRS1]